MTSVLFWIAIGLIIGWNLPQPGWAKFLQDKLLGFFRKLVAAVRKKKK